MKYKLFNKKTGSYVQELKNNFVNACGVASCGYHFEDVVFSKKAIAELDRKMRKSHKDLIVVEVEEC